MAVNKFFGPFHHFDFETWYLLQILICREMFIFKQKFSKRLMILEKCQNFSFHLFRWNFPFFLRKLRGLLIFRGVNAKTTQILSTVFFNGQSTFFSRSKLLQLYYTIMYFLLIIWHYCLLIFLSSYILWFYFSFQDIDRV